MLWIKAFHIITVITWFAGIFYLPRLFVYHTELKENNSNTTFKTMERRLYYGIMMPSFVITTTLGLWLLFSHNLAIYSSQYWLITKLVLVALLIVYHFACGYFVRVFKNDNNTKSAKFYRIFNEIPVIILIAIIILVVVKPF